MTNHQESKKIIKKKCTSCGWISIAEWGSKELKDHEFSHWAGYVIID